MSIVTNVLFHEVTVSHYVLYLNVKMTGLHNIYELGKARWESKT